MALFPTRTQLATAWKALTSKPAEKPASKPRLVRMSSYRGAEVSRLTGDVIARTQSPVDQLRGDLRILRARGRDMSLNDPFGKKFLNVMSAQVLGPKGPRLQMQIRDQSGNLDEELNRRIEQAWEEWCCGPVTVDRCFNFHQYQQLAFRTMLADGESFARKVVGPQYRHGLALQPIDADMVDETYTVLGGRNGDREIWLGVEVDGNGVRQGYHVFDGLYSQSHMARPRKVVPASEMLHIFVAERFNQARGVTWFAPVIVPGLNLAGFIDAVLVGARAGASQMAFIEQDPDQVSSDPVDAEGTAGDSGAQPVEVEISPGLITRLAPGEKLNAFNPSQPTDTFDGFVEAISRFYASGVNISYAALTGDYSKANYSSERAAQLIESALNQVLQERWVYMFLQPVFEQWLETAALSGAIRLPSYDTRKYAAARWAMKRREYVDPAKDLEAIALELRLGLTSVSAVMAERGREIEEVLQARKADQDLAKKFGIDLEALISSTGASAAGRPKADAEAPDTTETPEPESPAEDADEETED